MITAFPGATAALLTGIMFGWADLLAYTIPLRFMALAMIWHGRAMENTWAEAQRLADRYAKADG